MFLVADFYSDMQSTATELLSEFNQGVVQYIPPGTAVNDWETAVPGTPVTLEAVARGPSQKYLSELIAMSDIELTVSVFGQNPTSRGKITIDGIEKQIIAVQQIPAAGTPVCWKIWCKG